jgi:hypothetical protein
MTNPIGTEKSLAATTRSYGNREEKPAAADTGQARAEATSADPARPSSPDVQTSIRSQPASAQAPAGPALEPEGVADALAALREALTRLPETAAAAHGRLTGADVEAMLAAPAA